jgi:ribose transport system ATP-binding protein
VRALDGVDLDVRKGEVHCLLGQNGAGKSTLIKILSGAHQPDSGTISLDGEPVQLSTPTAAMRAGIATIYQELDLVNGLSVAENIFLGHEHARFGFNRRGETRRDTTQLLARLGHPEIAPDTEVGGLSPAAKQIVSMARALSHDARLIIMDEPSAALAHDEVANLFRIIRDLAGHGVSVVYISHRLDEIREIGDRVTVLKDGRAVASGLPARDTPTREIVSLMTGRSIEHAFPDRTAAEFGEDVLRVTELTIPGVVDRVSFTVRAGEIVGLAGLVGSGRSEILEAVYGARPASGTVEVKGRPVRGGPHGAVRLGVGLAPEERKAQALLLDQSVAANITLATLKKHARFGWIDRRGERAEAKRLIEALDVRPPDLDRAIRTLSGGNQQKAVLARWLAEDRTVLLLDEPTRGVDVGAKAEIYRLISELSATGLAVVVVSSEMEELMGLSTRILIMREGELVAEVDGERATEVELLSHAVAPTDTDVVLEETS